MVLLKRIFTSRSLLGIILAALCLLLTMLTMTGMNPYIFPYYFKNTAAQSAVAMCSSIASLVVVAPLATMLASKIGKKETAIAGSHALSQSYLICFILHPESGWVYLGFYTVAYAGLGLFNTIVWAMITDVIDDQRSQERRPRGRYHLLRQLLRPQTRPGLLGRPGGRSAGHDRLLRRHPAGPQRSDGNLQHCLPGPHHRLHRHRSGPVVRLPLSKKVVDGNVVTLKARRTGRK